MDTDNTDRDTVEEEKKAIGADLDAHATDIVEPDEAARSAEGMDDPEDPDNMLTEDVPEDRDATPPMAADIPGPNIIQ